MSKKIFISQPMGGKTEKEIMAERGAAIRRAWDKLGKDIVVLDTFFDDFGPDTKPLDYLARSLEYLARADVAVFGAGKTPVAAASNTSAHWTTVSP